jgi:serine/threonine protein phosphatase PrpC
VLRKFRMAQQVDEGEDAGDGREGTGVGGDGNQRLRPEDAIQAGCTAVVAFLSGRKLYVANAGEGSGVRWGKQTWCVQLSREKGGGSMLTGAMRGHPPRCFSSLVALPRTCTPPPLSLPPGDSRAVLCRGGKAIPLSVDHKPAAASERERITAAGGFLSDIGGITRVNGNLNLSRAIGDLRYKMNAQVGWGGCGARQNDMGGCGWKNLLAIILPASIPPTP